jgi:diphthamide biosynthesis protein 7
MPSVPCDFIEHVKTPLNACSVETLPDPIELKDGTRAWPLMLGCYELEEATGKRKGRLDFYTVPVPMNGNKMSGLGAPTQIIGDSNEMSGVLDGKWYPKQLQDDSLLYATAHASGEIAIHKIEQQQEKGFKTSQAEKIESGESGLCLSLAWDLTNASESTSRMISSYSNGKVSIHQANISQTKVELVETESWDAHKMFRSPAEVWCASFTSDSNVVMSGGDEGSLKIWDLRAGLSLPMHILKNFEAGVTVLSPHPRIDHLVACGSYDETVAIFDLRHASHAKPKPLCHSDAVGGGLWRMKWHPFDDHRLLLGAMHGGCRVVQLDGLGTSEESYESISFQIQQEFTNHESMAYGADWLACKNSRVEAAASCSFYDRALYLWEVKKGECK